MTSFGPYLFQMMSAHSDLNALKIGTTFVSYGGLLNRSLQIANLLRSGNSQSKPRVGILGQRSFSTFSGVLGSLFSGGVYVPLNTKLPSKKLRDLVLSSNLNAVVAIEEEWQIRKECFIDTNVRQVLFPESELSGKLSDILLIGRTSIEANEGIPAPIATDPSSVIYLLYTSGSTGQSKGVEVTGENILALMMALGIYYDVKPGYRASQTFDLSFDPSVCDMYFTWLKGGVLCVLPQVELMCPWDYIRREQIEFWHSVPALATIMRKLKMLNEGDFPSLRFSIFTGEPLRQDIAEAWKNAAPNSTVENRYGPTEATVDVSRFVATNDDYAKDYSNGILPIGLPHPGTSITIVDESSNPVADGTIGEIVLGGPQVAVGYFDDAEKTLSSFVKFDWDLTDSDWYRTGDLGFINADGNVECLGRRDSQIKIAGRRVEIGEIEGVLIKTSVVKEVIVVAVRDKNLCILELIAWTEDELSKAQIMEMKKLSRDHLEDVFFPKRFKACGQLPLTSNGKIDRKALEQRAAEEASVLN